MYRPEFVLNTTLPQKDVVEEYIPSNEDIKALMNIDDQELLDAICLAAFGPMRRSEICALTSDDIKGNVVHVSKAMVWNGTEWVLKKTKTAAGDRFIEFPEFVIERFKGREGNLFSFNPNMISNRFHKKLKKIGLESFRFHSLRHFASSYFHYLGLPDKAIQNRAGWESDYTMKKIYRHALEEEQRKFDSLANDKLTEDFKMN
jgi:integrase